MSSRIDRWAVAIRRTLIVIASVHLLLAYGCWSGTPQTARIRVDPTQKFQVITGWEATAQIGEHNSPAIDRYKKQVLDMAVNDLGINRLRLEIRSGVENHVDYFAQWQAGQITEREFWKNAYTIANDNDDPFVTDENGFRFTELDSTIESVVIPMKKLLANRGEELFLNLNYVDMGPSEFKHRGDPEEYAEFVLAAFQHIQSKYGFVPDALEVVLEPDGPNSHWTARELAKAASAASRRLKSNGFEPALIAPSNLDARAVAGFIDEMAAEAGALDHVSEICYHRYRGDSEPVLREIAEIAKRWGKQTSMLEKIGADHDELHNDLKIAGVSAWQQYTLAFPNLKDDGAQYLIVDDREPNSPAVTFGRRTKFLSQYFRFIRRGAQRIGSATTNDKLDPVAFINADGTYVLVVNAGSPGTMEVDGLPAGNYGVSYTTVNEANSAAPEISLDAGETLRTAIPAKGVLTIYGKAVAATDRTVRNYAEF